MRRKEEIRRALDNHTQQNIVNHISITKHKGHALKLPNYIVQHLNRYEWELQPDGTYVKDGVKIYIHPAINHEFAVQLTKMSVPNSKIWNNLVSSDDLHEVIRTTRPPKK